MFCYNKHNLYCFSTFNSIFCAFYTTTRLAFWQDKVFGFAKAGYTKTALYIQF